MIEVIEFEIKAIKNGKEEKISFKKEYTEEGECTGAYSYNPTNGWTGYTQFDSNWSEQDEDLNELLCAIHEYSISERCADLVDSSTSDEVGETYPIEYYCDEYVHENDVFNFEITINGIYKEELS